MSADQSASRTTGSSASRVRFGPFEFDCAPGGELRKNGVRIRLQEQPARLLAVLVENAGRAVARDELRQRVWANDTFVDFDHGLNTAIRKLRVALDDTADTPRWIETVPRLGYRFVGALEPLESAIPAAPQGADESPTRRWPVIALVAAVLAVLAAGAFLLMRRSARPRTIEAIAVLPFANADAATRHMSDGLTEGVINGLSEIGDLRVMARSTVFALTDRTLDPRRAGSRLKVPAVVAGAMEIRGEQIAVQVELIDVGDGAQIWGHRYAGSRRSMATMQEQILDDVSRVLRPARQRARPRTLTAAADAYDLYLKGLYAWNKRHPDDLRRAVVYFNEAVKIDPEFALAWAGLASAYGVMAGNGAAPPAETQFRSRAAAEKALALDPKLAEALASRAAGKHQYDRDFAGAERDYLRAIELNPSYSPARGWYAHYLIDVGRPDQAVQQAEIAYQLDPFSRAANGGRCWIYYYAGRFDEAIAFQKKAVELDRDFRSPSCLFLTLAAVGRIEEGILELTAPGSVLAAHRQELLDAFHSGGRSGLGHRWAEIVLEERRTAYVEPRQISAIYAFAGDRDATFRWLERAFADRAPGAATFYSDPGFEALKDDPRFLELARRMGLPQVKELGAPRPPAKPEK